MYAMHIAYSGYLRVYLCTSNILVWILSIAVRNTIQVSAYMDHETYVGTV